MDKTVLSGISDLMSAMYETKAVANQKKLLFIIGDGLFPIKSIIHETRLLKDFQKIHGSLYTADSPEFIEYKWRIYEYARFYTANHHPTLAHSCVLQLARDGFVDSIVTTNYDMMIDSLLSKCPDLDIAKNPVLAQYEYPFEDYYSSSNMRENSVAYWKIHGSLDHVVFRKSDDLTKFHLHKLPRFPVSSNLTDEIGRTEPKLYIPYLGWERDFFVDTTFHDERELDTVFSHHIDWNYNNDRRPFNREIESVKEILKSSDDLAGIVLLGFKGYYNTTNPNDPNNEEIVPLLLDIAEQSKTDIYMIVTRRQYSDPRPVKPLIEELKRQSRCYASWDISYTIGEILDNGIFPFDEALYQHKISCKLWYVDMEGSEYAR